MRFVSTWRRSKLTVAMTSLSSSLPLSSSSLSITLARIDVLELKPGWMGRVNKNSLGWKFSLLSSHLLILERNLVPKALAILLRRLLGDQDRSLENASSIAVTSLVLPPKPAPEITKASAVVSSFGRQIGDGNSCNSDIFQFFAVLR